MGQADCRSLSRVAGWTTEAGRGPTLFFLLTSRGVFLPCAAPPTLRRFLLPGAATFTVSRRVFLSPRLVNQPRILQTSTSTAPCSSPRHPHRRIRQRTANPPPIYRPRPSEHTSHVRRRIHHHQQARLRREAQPRHAIARHQLYLWRRGYQHQRCTPNPHGRPRAHPPRGILREPHDGAGRQLGGAEGHGEGGGGEHDLLLCGHVERGGRDVPCTSRGASQGYCPRRV
ncbi:hypothetical protein K523DRAFT_417755 [Schizophyllum commune Tattone D]|nr:hypothetical protein K523DRAFT_417755 [Schizophyllum commune Tattone D]